VHAHHISSHTQGDVAQGCLVQKNLKDQIWPSAVSKKAKSRKMEKGQIKAEFPSKQIVKITNFKF